MIVRSCVLSISLTVLSSTSFAELHTQHCLFGCPEGASSTNDVIVRQIYTMSSNDRTKLSDWVAYRVDALTIGPSQSRRWAVDPLLSKDETLEPDDYRGANASLKTDRGHQVPLASFSGTAYWQETNYLSNITPQSSALNQGAWNRLEGAIRKLVLRKSDKSVYVLTGTLYEANMQPLPNADEPHLVPSGYWKVVSVVNGDVLQSASFIFSQDTPRGAVYCKYQVSVSVVEQRSGLDLFPELSDRSLEEGENQLFKDLGC